MGGIKTFREFKAELLSKKGVQRAYKDLAPEYAATRTILDLTRTPVRGATDKD